METGRRFGIGASLLIAMPIVLAGVVYAQFRQDFFGDLGGLRGEQGDPAELPPEQRPDRNLAGCHMFYTSVRREDNGAGWRTDYPWAQRNLLLRLSELTKTRVSWRTPGVPHAVPRPVDRACSVRLPIRDGF